MYIHSSRPQRQRNQQTIDT